MIDDEGAMVFFGSALKPKCVSCELNLGTLKMEPAVMVGLF